MKRGTSRAVAFFGVGVVFTALSATRPAFLAVGIAFSVIGVVLLVARRRPGAR